MSEGVPERIHLRIYPLGQIVSTCFDGQLFGKNLLTENVTWKEYSVPKAVDVLRRSERSSALAQLLYKSSRIQVIPIVPFSPLQHYILYCVIVPPDNPCMPAYQSDRDRTG